MKKIMTFALGLSLVLGAVSVPAQAATKKMSRAKRGKHANHHSGKRTRK
jgi:hypothetical protein